MLTAQRCLRLLLCQRQKVARHLTAPLPGIIDYYSTQESQQGPQGAADKGMNQDKVTLDNHSSKAWKQISRKFVNDREAECEPEYRNLAPGSKILEIKKPFHMEYNSSVLPELQVAYETWGTLNAGKDNAVMICPGLFGSSHAKSKMNDPSPGWWEKFIGPGCAVDTDKFFVICADNLGSCYGTSGPSSIDPITTKPYGTTFPIISILDMVHAHFLVADHIGIGKVHAIVGGSLGGMIALTASVYCPQRVGRMISMSSIACSHPCNIASWYVQREAIMMDPAWNKGHYYDGKHPTLGMKLMREIGILTYKSNEYLGRRFGRSRIEKGPTHSLDPMYMVESYLDYQGKKFSTKFDPNSFLYLTRAMDSFDISEDFPDIDAALAVVRCPALVVGITPDNTYPSWQQELMAHCLKYSGNRNVVHIALDSLHGHDTYLVDVDRVGSPIKGFLETDGTSS